jgi:hypothetical protein
MARSTKVEPEELRGQVSDLGVAILVTGLSQPWPRGAAAANRANGVGSLQTALEGADTRIPASRAKDTVVEQADDAVGLADADDTGPVGGEVGEGTTQEEGFTGGVAAGLTAPAGVAEGPEAPDVLTAEEKFVRISAAAP